MTNEKLLEKYTTQKLEIITLRNLLGLMYDKWEDGTDCYEDPENCVGHLGKAIKLSVEEENQIIAALEG